MCEILGIPIRDSDWQVKDAVEKNAEAGRAKAGTAAAGTGEEKATSDKKED